MLTLLIYDSVSYDILDIFEKCDKKEMCPITYVMDTKRVGGRIYCWDDGFSVFDVVDVFAFFSRRILIVYLLLHLEGLTQ